jgi:radical SAM/Cys-rich protein
MRIKEKISNELNPGFDDLERKSISHISLNIGTFCNQQCTHCHLNAGPDKENEVMGKDIIVKIKKFINITRPLSLEITGGAPELNKHIIELIEEVRPLVKNISMRTNLTAMLDHDFSRLSNFLYDKKIALVASLPCYTKDNVDGQRGNGVFKKSINTLSKLNSIGFGIDGGVPIILVYNKTDFSLPPSKLSMEEDFRKILEETYKIKFTDLITMTNVPIGRFADRLKKEGHFEEYVQTLKNNHNPENLPKLMCLDQVTIDWKGRFYDCDFNLALDLPKGGWSDLDSYQENSCIESKIYTGYHCLSCTAGSGSSCHGSLT